MVVRSKYPFVCRGARPKDERLFKHKYEKTPDSPLALVYARKHVQLAKAADARNNYLRRLIKVIPYVTLAALRRRLRKLVTK